MTKFTDFIVDKIGYGVYNVHRNPQGSLYIYTIPILELPPRVFLGILSEYCTHKYSPELVNKDFGDFLVLVHILYMGVGVAPALVPLNLLGKIPKQP